MIKKLFSNISFSEAVTLQSYVYSLPKDWLIYSNN